MHNMLCLSRQDFGAQPIVKSTPTPIHRFLAGCRLQAAPPQVPDSYHPCLYTHLDAPWTLCTFSPDDHNLLLADLGNCQSYTPIIVTSSTI